MALALPSSLTPSKVAAFRDCALQFRFATIDRIPEPPSPVAAKGTLVHRALELLMWEEPPGSRTLDAALGKLERARADVLGSEEYAALELTAEEEATFVAEATTLLTNYFSLEDPDAVRVVGVELMLEATLGDLRLRGIIDRLELDDDGELVVTDYKTGRPPTVAFEQNRLGGVHFYALLCEQVLGRRPARVQLLYLAEPLAIVAEPSDQSVRGLTQRTRAIWEAVKRACERDDFRPKPSKLCEWCNYRALCPAQGGDPSLAAVAAGRPG
jgi:putative RecB family exonuclease